MNTSDETKKEKLWTDLARERGVDVDDPDTMHRFITAARWQDAAFATDKKKPVTQIAAELGIPATQVETAATLIRKDKVMMRIASSIVGEMYLRRQAESDTRLKLLSIFHGNFEKWLQNMSDIASGDTDAHPREQVAAFRALQEGELGLAFVKGLFVEEEEKGESPEEVHLRHMSSLKGGPVLKLDGVIMGEEVDAVDVDAKDPS